MLKAFVNNGITQALLGSRSGASNRLKRASMEDGAPIPLFLAPNRLKSFISNELLDGPLKPPTYQQGQAVVALMKPSDGWQDFSRMLNRALPRYGDTLYMPFEE